MKEVIQGARKQAGLTQEQAARKMFLGIRQYQRLEYGEQEMSAEEAVRLGDVLECRQLTMVYCAKKCAIGQRYCYKVLNNVDLSPVAILAKYRQEEREAHGALERMAEIMLNKRSATDCTEEELRELWACSLEALDLEHVVETLKLRLWDFLDVRKLVETHNRKCAEKRYYDPKRPELPLAG